MIPSPEDLQMIRDWADMLTEKMSEGLDSILVAFKTDTDPLRLVATQAGLSVLVPGEGSMDFEAWFAAQTASDEGTAS